MSHNIAIVGATGAVGRTFSEVLCDRSFPVGEITLLASSRSAGRILEFMGRTCEVRELTPQSFREVEFAFFSAGGDRSRDFANAAVRAGSVVIDNSSAFRMNARVPLVVPEVNPKALNAHEGIVANPNCSTIIMSVSVWPLHKVNPVRRIVVSTYQAVSGAGEWGIHELNTQAQAHAAGKRILPSKFPWPIYGNVFSHDSTVGEDGYNEEEYKMRSETWKIFGDPQIRVAVRCVRVPVERAHCESINLEFERPMPEEDAREILIDAPGIRIVENRDCNYFPMPIEASGQDKVLVSLRQDLSIDDRRGLDLWVSGDQLRKGAATNAVQIAELLMRR